MNWISVKERLPKENVFVLIYIKPPGQIVVGSRGGNDDWYADAEFKSENVRGEVTHWMPLPEPPR